MTWKDGGNLSNGIESRPRTAATPPASGVFGRIPEVSPYKLEFIAAAERYHYAFIPEGLKRPGTKCLEKRKKTGPVPQSLFSAEGAVKFGHLRQQSGSAPKWAGDLSPAFQRRGQTKSYDGALQGRKIPGARQSGSTNASALRRGLFGEC
jgi:hypothetical protein